MEYAIVYALLITVAFAILLVKISKLMKGKKQLVAKIQAFEQKKERRDKYTPELKNLVEYIEGWKADEEARWGVFYAAVSSLNGKQNLDGQRVWLYPNKTLVIGKRTYDVCEFDLSKNGNFVMSISYWVDNGANEGFGERLFGNYYGSVFCKD